MANDCQIWQAVRATSAAPSFFRPLKIDDKEYLDAGFGTNNPGHEVSLEVSTLHPTNPVCLVSIGSGKLQAPSRSKSGLLSRISLFSHAQTELLSILSHPETTHERMQNSALLSKDLSYFRFNVPGLEDVALDEWTTKERFKLSNSEKMQTIDFIERQTLDYLAQAEVRKSIHTCAQMIVACWQSL